MVDRMVIQSSFSLGLARVLRKRVEFAHSGEVRVGHLCQQPFVSISSEQPQNSSGLHERTTHLLAQHAVFDCVHCNDQGRASGYTTTTA